MKLLPLHHAHDVREITERWSQLQKRAGLTSTCLAEVEGHPVVALETAAAKLGAPAVYLSTGVHGDEAAAVWGLLLWAEKHARELEKGAFLLLPLLNPVGLAHNTRADDRGFDINRRFHVGDDPLSGPWQRWLADRPMTTRICLHEDYDAQGCYLYELGQRRETKGHSILAKCTRRIGIDPRGSIDGQRAKQGVIRRKKMPTHLPGMPEAIELHLRGCPFTLTFETPSEFSLDDRVATQIAFVEATLEVICP